MPEVVVSCVENFSENVEKLVSSVEVSWNSGGVCLLLPGLAETMPFPTIFPTVDAGISMVCGEFSKDFSTACAKLGDVLRTAGRKRAQWHKIEKSTVRCFFLPY